MIKRRPPGLVLFRSATTKVILSGASQPTKDWGGLKREGAILSSYLLLYVMGKSRKNAQNPTVSILLGHHVATPLNTLVVVVPNSIMVFEIDEDCN